MPLILGAQSAIAAGFSVDNSCRWDDGDSPYMHYTPGSTTSQVKWTYSVWTKRGNMGARQCLLFASSDAGSTDYVEIEYKADNTLNYQVKGSSGTTPGVLITTRLFRDPAAWYHLVFVWDSENASAGDRMKIYVNGTEETVFDTDDNPADGDLSPVLTSGVETDVGKQAGSTKYFDGYLAEVALIDGQAYAASDFGEFNADSPTIWQPKDISGLTFGTSGFYLDFEDSADLGNDVSGNGNDLTEVNFAATDQMSDSPTNNFCTLANLNTSPSVTLSEGNTTAFGSSGSTSGNVSSTICPQSGKWQAEIKYRTVVSNYPRSGHYQINNDHFGRLQNSTVGAPGYKISEGQYSASGELTTNNGSTPSWGSAVSAGQILQYAVDCDNGATYIGVQGTWQDSGDPTSGASKTGAAWTWTPGPTFQGISFGDSVYNGAYSDWNFGNPSYANTSDAADANGYGKFEYAPPTGYYALCTKNLAEFGG